MTDNLDEVRDLAATLGKDLALVVNHSGGKGCTLSHTSLLSARALTLREISLIAGSTLKVHPVPGIRLMRRTSHSPACSWTVWPPASSHFARCS
jgi:hypothetical protein